MVNLYITPEQAEASSPYAGNTGVVGQTAAQAAAIAGSKPGVDFRGSYGGASGAAYNDYVAMYNQQQAEIVAQEAVQKYNAGRQLSYQEKQAWYQDQIASRELAAQRNTLENANRSQPGSIAASSDNAYAYAIEARRKGDTINPYVLEKAILQGYNYDPLKDKPGNKAESRATVPIRSTESMPLSISAKEAAAQPTTTLFTKYDGQTAVEKVKIGYVDSGQFGAYQQNAQGRWLLVSSGSRAALQGGGMTVGKPQDPRVWTQESAGTVLSDKYADKTRAAEVIANRDLYSRPGAEAYGGYGGVRLDNRTIESSKAQLSTYANPYNLANLVSPQAVNLPKAEQVAMGEIPYGNKVNASTPTIFRMEGNVIGEARMPAAMAAVLPGVSDALPVVAKQPSASSPDMAFMPAYKGMNQPPGQPVAKQDMKTFGGLAVVGAALAIPTEAPAGQSRPFPVNKMTFAPDWQRDTPTMGAVPAILNDMFGKPTVVETVTEYSANIPWGITKLPDGGRYIRAYSNDGVTLSPTRTETTGGTPEMFALQASLPSELIALQQRENEFKTLGARNISIDKYGERTWVGSEAGLDLYNTEAKNLNLAYGDYNTKVGKYTALSEANPIMTTTYDLRKGYVTTPTAIYQGESKNEAFNRALSDVAIKPFTPTQEQFVAANLESNKGLSPGIIAGVGGAYGWVRSNPSDVGLLLATSYLGGALFQTALGVGTSGISIAAASNLPKVAWAGRMLSSTTADLAFKGAGLGLGAVVIGGAVQNIRTQPTAELRGEETLKTVLAFGAFGKGMGAGWKPDVTDINSRFYNPYATKKGFDYTSGTNARGTFRKISYGEGQGEYSFTSFSRKADTPLYQTTRPATSTMGMPYSKSTVYDPFGSFFGRTPTPVGSGGGIGGGSGGGSRPIFGLPGGSGYSPPPPKPTPSPMSGGGIAPLSPKAVANYNAVWGGDQGIVVRGKPIEYGNAIQLGGGTAGLLALPEGLGGGRVSVAQAKLATAGYGVSGFKSIALAEFSPSTVDASMGMYEAMPEYRGKDIMVSPRTTRNPDAYSDLIPFKTQKAINELHASEINNPNEFVTIHDYYSGKKLLHRQGTKANEVTPFSPEEIRAASGGRPVVETHWHPKTIEDGKVVSGDISHGYGDSHSLAMRAEESNIIASGVLTPEGSRYFLKSQHEVNPLKTFTRDQYMAEVPAAMDQVIAKGVSRDDIGLLSRETFSIVNKKMEPLGTQFLELPRVILPATKSGQQTFGLYGVDDTIFSPTKRAGKVKVGKAGTSGDKNYTLGEFEDPAIIRAFPRDARRLLHKDVIGQEPMVTLYRGEDAAALPGAKSRIPQWLVDNADPKLLGIQNARGRWFAETFDDALWYANDAGKGGVIKSVSVPKSVADQYRVSNFPFKEGSPRIYSASESMAEKEIFLPRELADKASPIASVFNDGNNVLRKDIISPATFERIPTRRGAIVLVGGKFQTMPSVKPDLLLKVVGAPAESVYEGSTAEVFAPKSQKQFDDTFEAHATFDERISAELIAGDRAGTYKKGREGHLDESDNAYLYMKQASGDYRLFADKGQELAILRGQDQNILAAASLQTRRASLDHIGTAVGGAGIGSKVMIPLVESRLRDVYGFRQYEVQSATTPRTMQFYAGKVGATLDRRNPSERIFIKDLYLKKDVVQPPYELEPKRPIAIREVSPIEVFGVKTKGLDKGHTIEHYVSLPETRSSNFLKAKSDNLIKQDIFVDKLAEQVTDLSWNNPGARDMSQIAIRMFGRAPRSNLLVAYGKDEQIGAVLNYNIWNKEMSINNVGSRKSESRQGLGFGGETAFTAVVLGKKAGATHAILTPKEPGVVDFWKAPAHGKFELLPDQTMIAPFTKKGRIIADERRTAILEGREYEGMDYHLDKGNFKSYGDDSIFLEKNVIKPEPKKHVTATFTTYNALEAVPPNLIKEYPSGEHFENLELSRGGIAPVHGIYKQNSLALEHAGKDTNVIIAVSPAGRVLGSGMYRYSEVGGAERKPTAIIDRIETHQKGTDLLRQMTKQIEINVLKQSGGKPVELVAMAPNLKVRTYVKGVLGKEGGLVSPSGSRFLSKELTPDTVLRKDIIRHGIRKKTRMNLDYPTSTYKMQVQDVTTARTEVVEFTPKYRKLPAFAIDPTEGAFPMFPFGGGGGGESYGGGGGGGSAAISRSSAVSAGAKAKAKTTQTITTYSQEKVETLVAVPVGASAITKARTSTRTLAQMAGTKRAEALAASEARARARMEADLNARSKAAAATKKAGSASAAMARPKSYNKMLYDGSDESAWETVVGSAAGAAVASTTGSRSSGLPMSMPRGIFTALSIPRTQPLSLAGSRSESKAISSPAEKSHSLTKELSRATALSMAGATGLATARSLANSLANPAARSGALSNTMPYTGAISGVSPASRSIAKADTLSNALALSQAGSLAEVAPARWEPQRWVEPRPERFPTGGGTPGIPIIPPIGFPFPFGGGSAGGSGGRSGRGGSHREVIPIQSEFENYGMGSGGHKLKKRRR